MRAYRVMLGREGYSPQAPKRSRDPARPLSSSVSFLGCHDTSPHAPDVRTNGGFCMDCLSDGAKSAGEAVLKRRSLDQFVADTVEATL